jgi:hypothetical protein
LQISPDNLDNHCQFWHYSTAPAVGCLSLAARALITASAPRVRPYCVLRYRRAPLYKCQVRLSLTLSVVVYERDGN